MCIQWGNIFFKEEWNSFIPKNGLGIKDSCLYACHMKADRLASFTMTQQICLLDPVYNSGKLSLLICSVEKIILFPIFFIIDFVPHMKYTKLSDVGFT